MHKYLKEKLIGATGSISGAASILGSWQVCHSVCLGIIAALGIIGISLTGMPLAFLTTIAVPVWGIAVILLGIVAYFYVTKKCVSKFLLLINSGLIIAGIPFQSLQPYRYVFWSVGAVMIVSAIVMYILEKLENKERCTHVRH